MFHELIFTDDYPNNTNNRDNPGQVCRAGSGGALWGLFCGLTIGNDNPDNPYNPGNSDNIPYNPGNPDRSPAFTALRKT